MRFSYLAIVTAVAVLSAGSAVAGGAPDKLYPPYPDVWGRRIDVPKDALYSELSVHTSGDGSKWIVLDWIGGPNGDVTHSRTDFFSGETKPLSSEERDALDRAVPKWDGQIRFRIIPRRRVGGQIDGLSTSLVLFDVIRPGEPYNKQASCQVYSILRDHREIGLRGIEEGKGWAVVRVLKSPVRSGVSFECWEKGADRKTFVVKVKFILPWVGRSQVLSDGSFLMLDSPVIPRGTEQGLVIRFDQNMYSSFVDADPELLVVDYDKDIAPVLADVTRRAKGDPTIDVMQEFQDRLYDRLKGRK